MYWTDNYPESPKIEVSWMSGENRTTLVNTRLGNPTGLTIDYLMGNRVFWCDVKENLIESMKSDGTDRVIVVSSGCISFQNISFDFHVNVMLQITIHVKFF